MIADSYLR